MGFWIWVTHCPTSNEDPITVDRRSTCKLSLVVYGDGLPCGRIALVGAMCQVFETWRK